MPRISVILPNYNHAKYLPERIESIINQTFKDFELIILDDYSCDNSIEVIESYWAKEPRISHFIKNNVNSGTPFIQWEKGIKLAKGEFIWIAESDDVADSNFLAEAIEMFDQNPDCGVVYSASIWIDENGKEIHIPDHENGYGKFDGNRVNLKEMPMGPKIYNASSALIRKDLIEKTDFEDLNRYKYCGDWLFWTHIFKDTQIIRLKERRNYFRRHSDNVSFKSEKEGLQYLEGIEIPKFIISEYSLTWCKKNTIYLKWAKKMAVNKITSPEIISKMPFEIRFYHKIFSLIY